VGKNKALWKEVEREEKAELIDEGYIKDTNVG